MTKPIAKRRQHDFELLAEAFSHAAVNNEIDGGVDHQEQVMEAQHHVEDDRDVVSFLVVAE